jgi:formate hydrogenlyase subunit 3/multisubunit Na+/H+ antiporter MnhD subunit
MLIGIVSVLLFVANPNLNWVSRIGLIVAAGFAGIPLFWAPKIRNVYSQLTMTWVGRFGIWLVLGYYNKMILQWEFSILLATFLLPFDCWQIKKRKEKQLDELSTQNLPPISFDLK